MERSIAFLEKKIEKSIEKHKTHIVINREKAIEILNSIKQSQASVSAVE